MTKQESMLQQIKEYSEAYYTGVALIEDDEFDALVEEYEKEFGKINKVGWGYEPKGNKATHKYSFVGSLNKTRSTDNIDFRGKIITDKLDGLSCVAYYENGKLVKAITRGNGKEGLDITDKLVHIDGGNMFLPPLSSGAEFTGAVRGEIMMTYDKWNQFINKYKDDDYRNPRNAAAGVINRKDVDPERLSYLIYITYKIIAWEGRTYDEYFTTYEDHLNDLFYFGFNTVRYIKVSDDADPHKSLQEMEEIFNEGDGYVPRDGLVITDNQLTINNEGVTFFNEFAFKFKSEVAITTVVDIEWNLSRTGKYVPTVITEPVELSGATVKRATGFHAQFIKDHEIGVGKKIMITRSGEVIPTITAVFQEYDDGYVRIEYIYDDYKPEDEIGEM